MHRPGLALTVCARMSNPHSKVRSSASSFASSLDHLHRPRSRAAPNVRSRMKNRHVLVTYSRRFPLVSFVSSLLSPSASASSRAGYISKTPLNFRDLLVARRRPIKPSARG
ncbi:hypothetical protein DAEQUDRAFT_349692 [Daedalea quercina L-15889]|uniref:Uncharacterized protein n=1 Tax=Daedalea quercina L-15889 TaxID=1314783 RepID=A0A165PE27_9APHY|nr:hypothetical protein DAEQUDRAFT_349692 [Daedalea quercina L-15889]